MLKVKANLMNDKGNVRADVRAVVNSSIEEITVKLTNGDVIVMDYIADGVFQAVIAECTDAPLYLNITKSLSDKVYVQKVKEKSDKAEKELIEIE